MNNNPKSWSDVSINKYIQLYNLKDETEDFDILIKTVSILTNKSIEELETMPFKDFKIITADLEFNKTEPKQTKPVDEIILLGEKFYLRKNLDELSVYEMADLEFYKKDVVANLHQINSLLYKNENGNPKPEVILNELDIESGLSVLLFFYLIGNDYLMSDTAGYSLLDRMIQGMEIMKMENQKEKLSEVQKKKRKAHKNNSLGSV